MSISIHALLAESDHRTVNIQRPTAISIHALLAESDDVNNPVAASTSISIHALLAESDSSGTSKNLISTLYFYPRSPCGERQPAEHHASSQQEFLSTLSLRRATFQMLLQVRHTQFLSTLSLRRATASNQPEQQAQRISIHALLAESDPFLKSSVK